ncbi:hypothetical protein FACS189472_11250 [Alphaproteobacteria bacterium]|nr:hypothetical protein FACS189472_11250 [Alphaproteobacteria bacterium]
MKKIETLDKGGKTKNLVTTYDANLFTLSIAAAFHGKKKHHPKGFYDPIYYDVFDGKDFVHKALEKIFEVAKGIAEDNMYPQNREAERLRKKAKITTDKDLKEKLLKKADEIDIPYNWKEVPMLGYNSSKFDLNFIIKNLHCNDWKINEKELMIGGVSSFKKIIVTNVKSGIALAFIDAKNFVAGGTLAKFVKTFGKKGQEAKGMFPYEAFNSENYEEYLSECEPSPIEDFKSTIRNDPNLDHNYNLVYLKGLLKAKKNSGKGDMFSRRDYLKYYNLLDVEIMIEPVLNLIEKNYRQHVDMLQNFSLSSVGSQARYASCHEDFDVRHNYNVPEKIVGKYYLTLTKFRSKCYSYLQQDMDSTRKNTATPNF